MALDHDGLLSAITSAIDTEGGTPPATETTTDDASTDGEASADAGSETAEGVAEAGASEGAASDTAATAAGADGQQPDIAAASDAASGSKGAAATGKDQPASATAGKDGLKPGEKPAEAPKKAPDPINDPIDERLKPATKERMTALVTTAKQLTTERDQYKGQFEELTGYIAATGANPEQYAQALDYLRMVNSPNVEDRKQCLAFMQREMKALAVSLGEPVAGVDLLSDHADLQQRVRDGEISQQDAEELAAARSMRQHTTQVGQRNVQQTQANQQAYAAGRDELNSLEAELRAIDPAGYEAKRGTLIAALKPKLAAAPPSQWAGMFLKEYTKLSLAPAPAAPAPARKPVVPASQPLRATNPAGGTAPAANSLAQAIEMGIQAGTRR